MSSSGAPTNSGEPDRFPAPSLARELWTLGKVILGALLIAFGCWRVWVFAFGHDESLLFGYRVRAASAAEQARLLREHNRELRELKRTTRDLHLRADRAEELQRSLAVRLEEQAERDRRGYRTQRWMELVVVVFAFAVGPGLVASGRGYSGAKERNPPSQGAVADRGRMTALRGSRPQRRPRCRRPDAGGSRTLGTYRT